MIDHDPQLPDEIERCRWCRVYWGQDHRLWCPATLRHSWWIVLLFTVGGVGLALIATYGTGIPWPPRIPWAWVQAGVSVLNLALLVWLLVLLVRLRSAGWDRYQAQARRFAAIEQHDSAQDTAINTLTQRIDLQVKRHYDHQSWHNEREMEQPKHRRWTGQA